MSWITELGIAALSGLLTPFLVVLFAGLLLRNRPRGRGLLDFAKGLAATAYARGLVIEREHGGWSIVATSYDARFGSERGKLDGETKDWYDTHGLMTEFYGMPFGVAHEGFNTILDPATADVAREFVDAKKNDSLTIETNSGVYRRSIIELPTDERPALTLTDASKIIQGSSDPGATYRKDAFQELSQAVWNKVPKIDYLIWLVSLGVGVGLMYLAAKLRDTLGSDDGGTVTQPLVLAIDTLGVVL